MKRFLIALPMLCMCGLLVAGHPPRFRRLPLYAPNGGVAPVDPNVGNTAFLLYMNKTNATEPVAINSAPIGIDFDVNLATANEPLRIDSSATGTNDWYFFDNVADYLVNRNLTGMDTDVGVFSFHIKLGASGDRGRIFQMENEAGATPNSGFFIEQRTDDRVGVQLVTNGTVRWRVQTTAAILTATIGEWHMWTVRFNGGFVQFYLDGVAQALTYTVSTETNVWLSAAFAGTTPPDYMALGAGLFSGVVVPMSGGHYRSSYYTNLLTPAEILLLTNTSPVDGTEVLP